MTLRSQGAWSREAGFRVPSPVTLARGTVHVLQAGYFCPLLQAASRTPGGGDPGPPVCGDCSDTLGFFQQNKTFLISDVH